MLQGASLWLWKRDSFWKINSDRTVRTHKNSLDRKLLLAPYAKIYYITSVKRLNTLYLFSNTVAPWGRPRFVAETCRRERETNHCATGWKLTPLPCSFYCVGSIDKLVNPVIISFTTPSGMSDCSHPLSLRYVTNASTPVLSPLSSLRQ
jgi:hypothetical protein